MARAVQKRKEDEKRIMEKLEKEETEREQRAAKMKEKADKLAIITAERVEKLMRDKALAKGKERLFFITGANRCTPSGKATTRPISLPSWNTAVPRPIRLRILPWIL